MRVIAGRAKGHHLKAPRAPTTRPTSDKVRGAIFAMVESLLEAARGPEEEEEERGPWEGCRVLDLFAGTGALGIEALSRGAARADFVEANSAACQAIRENLAHTKLASLGKVFCLPARVFLQRQGYRASEDEAGCAGYQLILMDPPYAEPKMEDLLAVLGTGDIVRDGGWLVVEHAAKRPLPSDVSGLTLVKHRCHGDTDISIYVRRRPDEVAATSK